MLTLGSWLSALIGNRFLLMGRRGERRLWLRKSLADLGGIMVMGIDGTGQDVYLVFDDDESRGGVILGSTTGRCV